MDRLTDRTEDIGKQRQVLSEVVGLRLCCGRRRWSWRLRHCIGYEVDDVARFDLNESEQMATY